MAATSSKIESTLCILNNIPSTYHASDLRNFFSEFIETQGFECFHFRHRPEKRDKEDEETVSKGSRPKRTCCVFKVKTNRLQSLLEAYNRTHWLTTKGNTMPLKCFIKIINVEVLKSKGSELEGADKNFQTRGQSKSISSNRVDFTQSDLDTLIELRPPPTMPNGNVGTPTKIFLDLIKNCRLPPSIVGKLKLVFPRNKAKRMYSSVPFDYTRFGGKKLYETFKGPMQEEDNMARTAQGHLISQAPQPVGEDPIEEAEEEKETEISDDDDDFNMEEWERHESLHSDITSQERTKERLFEEKIELKWEKGGSGLVFYTDAQYWDKEEGDFDERTADDWDVDMSIYYEPGAGDKDAKDMKIMRREEGLRKGHLSDSVRGNSFETERGNIGHFERFTKGFGKRLMENQGWKKGQGLGKTFIGRSEPIPDDGQSPWNKKGFGYRGEKLKRNFSSQGRRAGGNDRIRINTVYDGPNMEEPIPLLRSDFSTRLTFRKKFIKATT